MTIMTHVVICIGHTGNVSRKAFDDERAAISYADCSVLYGPYACADVVDCDDESVYTVMK